MLFIYLFQSAGNHVINKNVENNRLDTSSPSHLQKAPSPAQSTLIQQKLNSVSSTSLDSIDTESVDSAISVGVSVSSGSLKTCSDGTENSIDPAVLNTTELLSVTDDSPPQDANTGETLNGEVKEESPIKTDNKTTEQGKLCLVHYTALMFELGELIVSTKL